MRVKRDEGGMSYISKYDLCPVGNREKLKLVDGSGP